MLKFRRIAPGSYEAYYADGTVEVYRNCDCGKCPAWVVRVYEDWYEVERWEQFDTKREAVAFALTLDLTLVRN